MTLEGRTNSGHQKITIGSQVVLTEWHILTLVFYSELQIDTSD